MKQIKINAPPVEQKYIDRSQQVYGEWFYMIRKAFIYAGAVGFAKYGGSCKPHLYSKWHWFAKAVKHLWRYWRGSKYDADGQHHLGAAVFAITMLMQKVEG